MALKIYSRPASVMDLVSEERAGHGAFCRVSSGHTDQNQSSTNINSFTKIPVITRLLCRLSGRV